jgi:hypothetical protein
MIILKIAKGENSKQKPLGKRKDCTGTLLKVPIMSLLAKPELKNNKKRETTRTFKSMIF